MEFLVHGILDYGEPGVFMAFEETAKDLTQNVASFGYDLEQLQEEGKLAIDHVLHRTQRDRGDRRVRSGRTLHPAGHAVDSIKAKRVVLDTIEVLFAGLKNQSIIRAELRRLFRWLKDRGLTAIVTGERGEGTLTRYGLEEYVADCVILLDHRVTEQISTRRLRIVKYRGSLHGTDEYPFLMGENGISVLPITSVGLTHAASSERISSGVADLDKMMGGKGFFRGSSILVSGTAGTGKSSLALNFLKAACERGERALYFGFEESMDQIVRNKTSIGLDLRPWIKKGLLHFHNVRPSSLGLEAHLASMHQIIKQVDPKVVVMDPITNFISVSDLGGHQVDAHAAGGFPEDEADHRHVYASVHPRRPAGKHGRERIVDHGHVAVAARRGARGPQKLCALRAEIARHGAFPRNAGVHADRQRHSPGRHLHQGAQLRIRQPAAKRQSREKRRCRQGRQQWPTKVAKSAGRSETRGVAVEAVCRGADRQSPWRLSPI